MNTIDMIDSSGTATFSNVARVYVLHPGSWNIADGAYTVFFSAGGNNSIALTNSYASTSSSGPVLINDIGPQPGDFLNYALAGFASGLLIPGGFLLFAYVIKTLFNMGGVRNDALD